MAADLRYRGSALTVGGGTRGPVLPLGARPAIHPGQTACDETRAAQFSRWGFGRRSIPAEPRRCAPLIVAFRSEYTRASSPGGGSSLTRLVSRTPTGRTGPPGPRRSRGFHHRLFTASLRAARRCVSVEIHQVFLPHAPCQPGASPLSALTPLCPQAVNARGRGHADFRSRNVAQICVHIEFILSP